MAITATTSNLVRDVGAKRTHYGSITLSGTYDGTGGFSVTPGQFGLFNINQLTFDPAGGYTLEYVPSTGKVRVRSSDDGRVLKFVSRTLSIAEVSNLNSSPITLIPATLGYVTHVEASVGIRHGAAYATAPGNINLRCVTSSPFLWSSLSSSLLTNAGSGGLMAAFSGINNVSGAASDDAAQVGSKAVDIFSATGNPTVTGPAPGSQVTIGAFYRLYPTYPTSQFPPTEGAALAEAVAGATVSLTTTFRAVGN